MLDRFAILLFLCIFLLSYPAQESLSPDLYEDLIEDYLDDSEQGSSPAEDRSRREVKDLLRYIYFSRVAFLVRKDREQILAEFPGAFVSVTKKTNSKFFVHKNDDKRRIIISIRGTANLKNWAMNLQFWMKENSWFQHKIHTGFLSMSQDIQKQILPFLEKEYEIILTGHSMGAAIATIIGAYLDNQDYDVEVINYAQPRVTDNDGAKELQSLNLSRVVIEGDVVNMLPPFNYAHFGREILLKANRYYPRYLQEEWDRAPEDRQIKIGFQYRFGGPSSSPRSQPSTRDLTNSTSLYYSFIDGGNFTAAHSLHAYFNSLRARISKIQSGVKYPLNAKLRSIQF